METIDFKRLNDSISEELMKPIKCVYIDLPYIQDIYYGALVLMNDNEDVYNYIYNNTENYNNRIARTHSDSFPELNISENTLVEFMKENVRSVIIASPLTITYQTMEKFHSDIVEHNERVSTTPIKEVEYIINTYPLELGPVELYILKNRITHIDPSIKVGVTSIPLNQLSEETLKNPDIFFVYDFAQLTEDDSPGKEKFVNCFFSDKKIFSPRRVGNVELLKRIPDMTENEIAVMFAETAVLLNGFTEFTFLQTYIWTESKVKEIAAKYEQQR